MTDGEKPGRRELKRLATWRAIRQATLDLTDELGWDNVSIELVAERADVSPRTVFNYFRSKDALLFEPDPEIGQQLAALVSRLPSGISLWEGLERVAISILDDNAAKLATTARLLREHPDLHHTVSSYNIGMQGQLASAFAERIATSNPPIVTRAASAAALGIVTAAIAEWDSSTTSDELAALVRAGFTATSTDAAHLVLQPSPDDPPTGATNATETTTPSNEQDPT